METRPFPFEQLPQVERALLMIPRRLREHLAGGGAAFRRWARLLNPTEGEESVLELTSVSACGAAEVHEFMPEPGVCLSLRGAIDQRALLWIDGRLCHAIVAAQLGTTPAFLSAQISGAERGLCTHAVASLLFEQGAECAWSLDLDCPVSPRPSSPPEIAAQQDPWVVAEARVRLCGCTSYARLFFPRSLNLRAPDMAAPAQLGRRLNRLTFRLPVRLASLRIPAAELCTLTAGDIIITPGCPAGGHDTEGVLVVGTGGFRAAISDKTLELAAPFQRGGPSMSNDETTSADAPREQGAIAAHLPVELVVELGRICMTGAEVLNLRPGDVIALDRSLGAPVDLRAGELLIGRGELVNVEGEAGIRLVELFE